ncbi:MAG: hypothetical protein IJX96_03750 [Clostridia bacterium]|nr:hypothetical protein [Clostridia bacterium]
MKAGFIKLFKRLGLDSLLWELLKRLISGLIKKLTSYCERLSDALSRVIALQSESG